MIGGVDQKLNDWEHTAPIVFGIMLHQILRDYASLGNWRDLTTAEIVYFYDGLRPELRAATKPKKGK